MQHKYVGWDSLCLPNIGIARAEKGQIVQGLSVWTYAYALIVPKPQKPPFFPLKVGKTLGETQ